MVTRDDALEAQITQWRSWLRRRPAIGDADVEELEGHLRDVVAALRASGLAADEAFLVAVKRMGNLDAVSREFAREHSERLWKQLVVAAAADGTANRGAPRETVVAVALAFAAAAAVKLPELFGFPRMGLFNDQVLFFPNKLAALGENLVLLVNLTWSAWLYARFLGGRGPFSALERWQTAYLPVYAAWAAFVVVAFPPLFGFK